MNNCPRCFTGSLINYHSTAELMCVSCGYEVRAIPQDVIDEVRQSNGKRRLKGSDVKLPEFGLD